MKADQREFAADTHTGLVRHHNEDCFAAEPNTGLWLVADGVGGHSCGEVASAIVKSTVTAAVAQGNSLEAAVRAAHADVLSAIKDRDDASGMGSTIIALQMRDDEYELCWVGDSRAYLYNGRLVQLTEDHNRVSELLARNAITAEQAASHPERHVLTQSLGISDAMALQPGHATGTLRPGESLLLCSDGLSDELSDSLMTHVLGRHQTPRGQVDALISAALEAGGKDNITAIVIGGEATRQPGDDVHDLETTRNTRRSASGGKPNNGKFPIKALALVTLVTLVLLVTVI